MPGNDFDTLRNAVHQPIAALTAVEVDTVWRAEELMRLLRADLGERPSGLLPLIAQRQNAPSLLDAAREVSRKWKDEEGVLFIIDQDENDETAPDFWRTMNLYREHWGALNCHVIFFLLPANYRFLSQIADHLADWMPLKLHILGDDEPVLRQDMNANTPSVFVSGDISPRVARQMLTALEEELGKELLHGRLDHTMLVKRYYLPMFEAAYAIKDLNRARSLREKIDKRDVPKAEIAKWLLLNGLLDYELHESSSAESALMRLFTLAQERKDETLLAIACHNLGMIAQQRRDFNAAETWYRKSLAIEERLENGYGAAQTYHQLGNIAVERRDFNTAEAWYWKSLEVREKLGDDFGTAQTYHQLGRIAEEQRDFGAAETLYRKSLEIKERLGDDNSAGITYHQLGNLAMKQRDLDAAEAWYRKSLMIEERLGDDCVVAQIYHQLGMISQGRKDIDAAEAWYRKSLEIKERQGNEYGTSSTYHQLGRIAQERHDFDTAKAWFNKSLKIEERLGNDYGKAINYEGFAFLHWAQAHYVTAGEYFIRAIILYRKSNTHYDSQRLAEIYSNLVNEAGDKDRTTLLLKWKNANLGDLPQVKE